MKCKLLVETLQSWGWWFLSTTGGSGVRDEIVYYYLSINVVLSKYSHMLLNMGKVKKDDGLFKYIYKLVILNVNNEGWVLIILTVSDSQPKHIRGAIPLNLT